mmetsp:Transcript_4642/g.14054  ORF Transcript_4642/g.14054 Transcript_4642/m.14054 type:complete len:113 (+) Transcript_4642:53-391(+)
MTRRALNARFAILRREGLKPGTKTRRSEQKVLRERVPTPEDLAYNLDVLLDQRVRLDHLLARRCGLSDHFRKKADDPKRKIVPVAQSTLGIRQSLAQQCDRLASVSMSKTGG